MIEYRSSLCYDDFGTRNQKFYGGEIFDEKNGIILVTKINWGAMSQWLEMVANLPKWRATIGERVAKPAHYGRFLFAHKLDWRDVL